MKECWASTFLVYDRCFCESDNAVTSGLLGLLISNEQKLCLYFIFFLLGASDAGWYKLMNTCCSASLTQQRPHRKEPLRPRLKPTQRLNVILASCQVSIHLHEMSHAQTWPHRVLNDSSMLCLWPRGEIPNQRWEPINFHNIAERGKKKKKKKKVVINSSQQAYGWM